MQVREAELADRMPDERAEPPDVLALRLLRRAVASLPAEEQQVVNMMAIGMKPKEITDALGIPLSAVAKALRTLRKSINVMQGWVRK